MKGSDIPPSLARVTLAQPAQIAGEETVRAADHQVLKDYYLLKGKAASAMQDEDDFAAVVSSGWSFPEEGALACKMA